MPVAVITVSCRGFGETPNDAMDNAKRRLNQFNSDQLNGNVTVDPGTDYRILDPGNGGPCAPERVRFDFLVAGQDLPEASKRNND